MGIALKNWLLKIQHSALKQTPKLVKTVISGKGELHLDVLVDRTACELR